MIAPVRRSGNLVTVRTIAGDPELANRLAQTALGARERLLPSYSTADGTYGFVVKTA